MAVEAAAPAQVASTRVVCMSAVCMPAVVVRSVAVLRARVLVAAVIAAAAMVIAAVAASFPASSPVLWSAARSRRAPIMAGPGVMLPGITEYQIEMVPVGRAPGRA